jgi:hypothetical protein
MTTATVTVNNVLHLLLEADSYPRQGNEDWRQADKMEVAALQKAEGAIESPRDPENFGVGWTHCAIQTPEPTSAKMSILQCVIILPVKGRARRCRTRRQS